MSVRPLLPNSTTQRWNYTEMYFRFFTTDSKTRKTPTCPRNAICVLPGFRYFFQGLATVESAIGRPQSQPRFAQCRHANSINSLAHLGVPPVPDADSLFSTSLLFEATPRCPAGGPSTFTPSSNCSRRVSPSTPLRAYFRGVIRHIKTPTPRPAIFFHFFFAPKSPPLLLRHICARCAYCRQPTRVSAVFYLSTATWPFLALANKTCLCMYRCLRAPRTCLKGPHQYLRPLFSAFFNP